MNLSEAQIERMPANVAPQDVPIRKDGSAPSSATNLRGGALPHPACAAPIPIAPLLTRRALRVDMSEEGIYDAHVWALEAIKEDCESCGDSFRPDQLTRIGRFHLRCVACEDARV